LSRLALFHDRSRGVNVPDDPVQNRNIRLLTCRNNLLSAIHGEE